MTCVAETNRAPFDFAEGESEIVSGFNIEYGAVGFALIFLAEYGNILVIRLFTVVIFMGGGSLGGAASDLVMLLLTVAVSYAFVWVRACYPRFRYDLLMGLTWKSFLPVSLGLLLLTLSLVYCIL